MPTSAKIGKLTSMTEEKANKKETPDTTTEGDLAISPKFKWEQARFVEAVLADNWTMADSIIEKTISTAAARRKWWDREDIRHKWYEYQAWLAQCRQQAGQRDWKYWDKRMDESRFAMGLPIMGQKVDITSGGEPIQALVTFVGEEVNKESEDDQ